MDIPSKSNKILFINSYKFPFYTEILIFNQHDIKLFFNLQAKRFMKHFLYVKEIDHGKKKQVQIVLNPTPPLKTKHKFKFGKRLYL